MSELATMSRSELVTDVLFHALRVRDSKLNALAAEVFSRLGTDPVRRLVLEAVKRTNATSHRLRAMTIIARIGEVSCPDDILDLTMLLSDRDPDLREAAARFLLTQPAVANA